MLKRRGASGESLNCADVDDVNPDNADACGEGAHGDASVSAAPAPFHRVGAGDVRHARGCGHARELHAGDRGHVVRPDAAKDRSPSITQPVPDPGGDGGVFYCRSRRQRRLSVQFVESR